MIESVQPEKLSAFASAVQIVSIKSQKQDLHYTLRYIIIKARMPGRPA